MSEHTPGPWGVLSYDVFKAASCRDAKKVLFECSNDVIESGANARRIVACVNACVGMADPAAEIAKLRAEREELRAALTICSGWVEAYGQPETRDIVRAALAKKGD